MLHTLTIENSMAYQCVCGETFPTYYMSYKHKKICEKCVKRNETKAKKHVEMTSYGAKEKNIAAEKEENLFHKCQMCNVEFSKRYEFEKHIEICDPFNIVINVEKVHVLDTDTNEIEYKRINDYPVKGRKEMGNSRSDKVNNNPLALVEVDNEQETELAKEKKHRHTNDTDEDKKFLEFRLSEPNYFTAENDSGSSKLRKRPNRKRKLKDFSDYITDFDLRNRVKNWKEIGENNVEENFKIIKMEVIDVENHWQLINMDHKYEKREPTNTFKPAQDIVQYVKQEHDKELILNTENVTSTLSSNKIGVDEDLKCIQSLDLRKTEVTNKRNRLFKTQTPTVLKSALPSVTSSKNYFSILPRSAQDPQTVTDSKIRSCESFMKTQSDTLLASTFGNEKKVFLTRQMENMECKKSKTSNENSNNPMNSFDEEDELNEVFEYSGLKQNMNLIEVKHCQSENLYEYNNKGLDDTEEDFDEEDERNELEYLDADNKDFTNGKEAKDSVIQNEDLKTSTKLKHRNSGKNAIKRGNAVIIVRSSEQIANNNDKEGNVFTCKHNKKNGIQRANQTLTSRLDITEDRNQKKELDISCTGQDTHFSKPFPFEKIDTANFYCMFDYCGTSCSDFLAWKKHLLKHSPPRIKLELKCCECGLELLLANRRRLREHILMRHHAMEKVIIGLKYCQLIDKDSQQPLNVLACVLCGFVMDDKHFDEKHVCKRTPLKFYCLFCKQSDAEYNVLQQHIADKHKEDEIHNQANLDKFEGLRTSMIDPASELDEQATTCKKCSQIFSTNQMLKLHVNETHAVFPFSCGICRQSYGRMDSLKMHFKNAHILEFKCEKCGKRFGDKKDYERHIVTHSGVRPFKCKLCINSYADERSLKYHCEKTHSQPIDPNFPNKLTVDVDEKNESFICELCGQCFQENKSFQRHIRQHNKVLQQPAERVCAVCSRTFKGSSNFSNHVCLPTDKLKTCVEIGAINRNVESIKEIYDKVELKMSSGLFKCKLCNQTFNKRKYLYAHVRNFHLSNDVKRLHCSVCGKGFEKQRALKNHLRIHSNSKPYQCRICKKTYRQLGHIRDHLLSHGSTPRFSCKLCLETYAAASGIKNHVIKHCCIKPFKCVVSACDQKFLTMNELLAHLRLCVTKHKESTIECTMCTHSLNDLTSALKHLVTHKNDEVYRCEICPATNKSYYQLFIHKGEANHFTEDERKTAEFFISRNKADLRKVTQTVNNMDSEELLKQYDFIPDETSVENNGLFNGVQGENNQEDVDKDTDTENIAEETFIDEETKILGDAQLANMGSADAPLVHDTEKNFGVTPYESSLNDIALDMKNSLQHDKLHKSTGLSKLDETLFSMSNLTSITLNHENKYHPVETGRPKSDQFEKSRFANSSISQTCKDMLIKTDANDITNSVKNTYVENVCEDNADDIVLSEEMLANCKILNEAGHIVNASYIDKSGHHVPIQCNVEMLQSLLNTGKYFLQYDKPNSDLKEAENLDVIATEWNTGESFEEVIECTEFGNIDLKPEQYIFERPSINVVDDNFELASDIAKHEKTFKKIPVVSKCRKLKNMDKVLGEIVDKEAKDGSETIEEGKINYKIRLKYYEDRTKLNDEYPLSCDICNRRYRRVKDLNLHKLRHLPSNLRPYKCQHCGKGYTSKSTFKSHLRIHSGAKPFVCEECGKCFRQLGQLQVHLRTHTGYKPFKCSECQKCFSTNSALKKHIETHEQIVKDVKDSVFCGLCGKGFMYEKQMRVHQVTHMSTDDQMELLKEFANPKNEAVLKEIDRSYKVKEEPEGNFMCDICGKTLTRNCSLEKHRAAHYIGEKVRCDQCGHFFKSEFNLRDHVKNVHSSKMYQCDFCGMELKKSSFKSHMAKHKGPAFQCNKCGTSCFRKERFFSHVAFCVGDKFFNKVMSFTGKTSQQDID